MPDPKCFVSYETEVNLNDKTLLEGQLREAAIPFTISSWSPKSSLPQSHRKKLSQENIKDSDFMIVLVNRNMGLAEGITAEIEMAVKHNVPVFGIYIGSASTNSNLPEILPRKRVIRWNWDLINIAVKKVLTEGKNK